MYSENLEKVGFVIRPSSPLADAVCVDQMSRRFHNGTDLWKLIYLRMISR